MMNIVIEQIERNVIDILSQYKSNFKSKKFDTIVSDSDILMDFFNITYETKMQNMQYWNRELGRVWELITKELFTSNNLFKPPESVDFGTDHPVDYFIGNLAIDAKYRIGSGDSGTLKKFKLYGKMLKKMRYNPVFLILRNDNLPAAITAAINGGWKIISDKDAFNFIIDYSGIDIVQYLACLKAKYDF